jgi:hypothetical protein
LKQILFILLIKYLIRKRRKLTGRAMNENWQLMGGKSNKAMDIISTLKFTSTSAVASNPNIVSKEKESITNDIISTLKFTSTSAVASNPSIVRKTTQIK